MPSGAKKRKAAKKKLLKQAHNFNGSHSLGTDTAKSHEERESDGGEGERESSEEPVVNKEEVSLSEQNVGEFVKEEKSEENYNDVPVNVEDDDDVRATNNGEHKRSSLSSSSSSSEDDDVAVEKEKTVEVEAGETGEIEHQVPSSVPEAASSSVEESIPVEESVKQVVSNNENENEYAENSVISQVTESEMKQNLDEVLPSADEKDKITPGPGVIDFVEEKIETKVIQVVDEGSLKLSGVVDRDGEGLLPQSSGAASADASCGDNLVKESETHKYVGEQPLISSAPLPVRRTSWTNCCGLFEVFSGGASR